MFLLKKQPNLTLPQQLAHQFRTAYFGTNWTERNLRELLSDVTLEQALTPVRDLNTIAVLVFHIHYYTQAQLAVLRGEPLTASDKYAFTPPPLRTEKDWQRLLKTTWTEADTYIDLLAQLPEARMTEYFADEKYGTYYANIQGNLEHLYYHLGQIASLKILIAGR